jgi:hypothetical protein
MTGREFAKVCRETAGVLEALAKDSEQDLDTTVEFSLKNEPETLKALMVPINAILDMKAD